MNDNEFRDELPTGLNAYDPGHDFPADDET
jgi:hypothetical protein